MSDKQLLASCYSLLCKIEIRGEYAEAFSGVLGALRSIIDRPDAPAENAKEADVDG